MTPTITIRTMTMADYPAVRALWEAEPGIKVSAVDQPDAVARLLQRCPNLSLVAEGRDPDGKVDVLAGVMGSDDTRRGYVHHLVVRPGLRGTGLGRRLMEEIGRRFVAAGIPKLHLFVMRGNDEVVAFYEHIGWYRRPDITLMSRDLPPA